MSRVAFIKAVNEYIREPLSTEIKVANIPFSVYSGQSERACAFCGPDALKKIQRTDNPVMQASRNGVLNLDDKPVKVMGEVQYIVDLDEPTLVRFSVVQNAPHPVLLGVDLLRQRKAAIDLGRMQMTIRGSSGFHCAPRSTGQAGRGQSAQRKRR